MLESLSVKNFAIIEDIKVDFKNGMTVLTGETGAGKSLIIDTISLLLGSRADSDMIRYNEDHASITGIFTNTNLLDDLFNKYSIPKLDKITLHREIWNSSKNVIKINNTSVSLAILKNVSSLLADIHAQNDTYKLFNPDNYLSFIDPKDDDSFDLLISNYSKLLFSYKEMLTKFSKIKEGQKNTLERLEFLEFEKNELESLNLYQGIDIDLEEKISKLSNYDKIYTSLNETIEYLDGDNSALDSIYNASSAISSISSFDSLYNDSSEKLNDCYYTLQEIKDNISHQLREFDFDQDELNNSIEKLNEINKVKDKYKKTVIELIKELENITLEIEMATNYDSILALTLDELNKAFNCLKDASLKLSQYRKKKALAIEKEIIKECNDLDLDNVEFKIIFDDVDLSDFKNSTIFKENGIDNVNFMISFNKGEPLKALYKVASGGEMSRIMLAFKSYLSKNFNNSLMVFDEIDTGVSGSTAKKIALKMHEISLNTQILCITHLPQVASIGDYHKHIYKVLDGGRTETKIKDLSYDERVEEIALMLSGDKLSLYALEHAKSLLKENCNENL